MTKLLRRLRYSLSARLLLLFLLTATLLIFILGSTLRLALTHHFRDNIRPHIVQYLDYVRDDLGDPPDIAKAEALSRRLPIRIYISGPEVNWSSTGRPLNLLEVYFYHRRSRRGENVSVGEMDDRFVLKTQVGSHTVFFEIPSRVGRGHGFWIGLGAIAIILLVVYITYRTIRRLFRPVADIQTGVQRIGSGELDYRMPIRRRDELGDLTASINAMAEDIRAMLDAKRQLLLGVSHELRSPLTRAKVALELLDDGQDKQALSDDLKEMEGLINELLETERLNSRHSSLNKTPVAINQLVNDVIEEHFPEQKIVTVLSDEENYVLLDAARIKLLISNLLANALRHNRAEVGAPRLQLTLTEAALLITVSDNGEGIASEHLPYLTEPFYRADPARQRQTGGFGLGLYLCRVIAEAHGGRLEINSEVGEGTNVIVRLPLQNG